MYPMERTTFGNVSRFQVLYLNNKRLIKMTAKQAVNVKTKRIIGIASCVVVRVPSPRIWETI